MDKNTTVSLPEIKAEIEELHSRLKALEAKVAEYEAVPDTPADFTDIEISVGELPEPEPVVVEDDLPEAEEPKPVAEEPEPAAEEPKPAAEEPKPKAKAKAEPKPKAEPVAKPFAWMTEVPAMSVKNIRSAISLQDRAMFIKTLFKEDFALYDSTISALNGMGSPEEAADYVKENFPDWNLRSDVVYEFMMAVRKKLG
ncbi:MAG: hypothetical protein J6X25_04585 [Bacteroidales bacterium]|nr:hypothetical protein [Bacteroidales bacterium]